MQIIYSTNYLVWFVHMFISICVDIDSWWYYFSPLSFWNISIISLLLYYELYTHLADSYAHTEYTLLDISAVMV